MGQVNPNEYLISIEHEDHFLDSQGRSTFNGSVWADAMYEADLRLKRWCVAEVERIMGQDLLRFGVDSLAAHIFSMA